MPANVMCDQRSRRVFYSDLKEVFLVFFHPPFLKRFPKGSCIDAID